MMDYYEIEMMARGRYAELMKRTNRFKFEGCITPFRNPSAFERLFMMLKSAVKVKRAKPTQALSAQTSAMRKNLAAR